MKRDDSFMMLQEDLYIPLQHYRGKIMEFKWRAMDIPVNFKPIISLTDEQYEIIY